jgi:hypothetical protein
MMASSTNNKDSSRFSKVAESKSENPQFEDFRRRPQNPSKPPIENKLSQMQGNIAQLQNSRVSPTSPSILDDLLLNK